jgi:hypothetical protein
MPCGLNFTCSPPRREKFGPTSVRSSSRALKRHQVKRVFSKSNASDKSKTPSRDIGPTMRCDGANQIMFKGWRNQTRTQCPGLF